MADGGRLPPFGVKDDGGVPRAGVVFSLSIALRHRLVSPRSTSCKSKVSRDPWVSQRSVSRPAQSCPGLQKTCNAAREGRLAFPGPSRRPRLQPRQHRTTTASPTGVREHQILLPGNAEEQLFNLTPNFSRCVVPAEHGLAERASVPLLFCPHALALAPH